MRKNCWQIVGALSDGAGSGVSIGRAMMRILLSRFIPRRGLALCIAVLTSAISVALAGNNKVLPTSLTYPSTAVGVASASQTVTVSNDGNTDLAVTSFSLSPFFVFQLDYGFARVIPAGEHAQFGIRFVPAKAVQYNGTFTLN